ncbi:MAG: DNA primase [Patescibacteria group bacterium]
MSQIKQIKDASNIIEIIGERLSLKKSGSSFRANCPFHSETTPSFFVSEQMQRYKCFGCGESGDVLEFLQKYDGLTFLESLQLLAQRAGIELKEFQKTSADEEHERLLEILHLAKEYYAFLLNKHPTGQKARHYLKDRGVSQDSLKIFQLGYSLPEWDGLIKYLHHKKKYKLEDILKTGLVIKTDRGRYYDRFRDRIMFPLKNHRGVTVGFSGRLLEKNAKEAKYINSPETQLYHKSQMLFGFSELYREIKKKGEVILVEGEFDVISSAQAHVNNVVAIKGSALTIEQVKLLERVVQRILLSLDSDSAGVEATRRAIEVVKQRNLELRVIDFSSVDAELAKKDPDDIARNSPALWRKVANTSISAYEFLLNIISQKFDTTRPEGKAKILVEMAPIINSINLAVEKDYYLQKLAKILNVKPEIIAKDIDKVLMQSRSGSRSVTKVSSKEQTTSVSTNDKPIMPDQRQMLEEYILFILFHDLADQKDITKKLSDIEHIELRAAGAKQIIVELKSWKGRFEIAKFALTLPEDLKENLFNWYEQPRYVENLDSLNLGKEWTSSVSKLEKITIHDKINHINQEIEKLDRKNDRSEAEEIRLSQLLAEIVQLQKVIAAENRSITDNSLFRNP